MLEAILSLSCYVLGFYGRLLEYDVRLCRTENLTDMAVGSKMPTELSYPVGGVLR